MKFTLLDKPIEMLFSTSKHNTSPPEELRSLMRTGLGVVIPGFLGGILLLISSFAIKEISDFLRFMGLTLAGAFLLYSLHFFFCTMKRDYGHFMELVEMNDELKELTEGRKT